MALEMKRECESCRKAVIDLDTVYICSYECTYCSACRAKIIVCPNCSGELLLRPRRPSKSASAAFLPAFGTNQQLAQYQPRRTRSASTHESNGWRLKVYEISTNDCEIDSSAMAKAMDFVSEHTPWPSQKADQGNVGFVIVHRGLDAFWLLIHLWQADILLQFAYQSPLDSPLNFTPIRASGFCGCVWELEVIKHERDAWVRWGLQGTKSSMENYLNVRIRIPTEST